MFRSHGDIERTPASELSAKKADEEKYECDFCTDGWCSETDVYIHRQNAHPVELQKIATNGNKRPTCLICIKRKKSFKELIKHLKSEHLLSAEDAKRIEREIFICNQCNQLFFNKAMLIVHLTRLHKATSLKVLTCPHCLKNIRKECILVHLKFHGAQSLSCCPICFKKCIDRAELLKHVQSHPGYYHCDTCSYTSKRAIFNQHVEIHNKNPKIETADEETDMYVRKFFVHPKTYWQMKVEKLNGVKGVSLSYPIRICILCREMCTNMSEMRRHILNHDLKFEEVKKSHICSCGEEFFNKVLLKHHIFKMKGNHRIVEPEPEKIPEKSEELIEVYQYEVVEDENSS